MEIRYRIHDSPVISFITLNVIERLPIFTTAERCNVITDAFSYSRIHDGLSIYAWVIMDNHIHALVSAPDLPGVLANLKCSTAQRVIEQLEHERCKWLLGMLSFYRSKYKGTSHFQVWQAASHPEEMRGDAIIREKMEHIHLNPVRRGLVTAPMDWRYSSAYEMGVLAEPLFRCDPWS